MEGKQFKQTERFSVMAKGSDYFLSLDDKSDQRYKVKIIYKGMSQFRFSFYEICVQNQWGHEILRY